MVMDVVVVIPAYNLQGIIGRVVSVAKRHADVIVGVDVKTKDRTAEEAARAGAYVVKDAGNGKGAVLRKLFAVALEKKYKYIISMDGDYQDKPEELPNFISEVQRADIVSGSRYLARVSRLNLFGMINAIFIKTNKVNVIGNILLFFIINFFSSGFKFKSWITDTQSGYRAYRREVLAALLPHLCSEKYEIESEMLFFASRLGCKIKEIPKHVDIERRGARLIDGLRIGKYMLKLWLKYLYTQPTIK